MEHVYHWKHGWIPLDHIAALSKAKGSHKAAARMLHDVAQGKHGHMSRQDVARAMTSLVEIHNHSERAKAARDLTAHADNIGHGDVIPPAMRRSGSTRDRLRGDMRTAQHAQQLRAEQHGKGYKSETAGFYGSAKHAQGDHTENRLTSAQADREAAAQAAHDREQARAYAEQKKAGQIANDLEHLDGVHTPDAQAASHAALEARTLASVRAKKMTPADVDATLQAAMRLPESPQQQALVSALATHLSELKAKADAHPVKAAADINAAAGARHAANTAASEADVKRTNIAEAIRNGNTSVSTPALVDLAGSDHPQAARAQAELDRRAVAQVAMRITSPDARAAAVKRAQAMPDGPLKTATLRALTHPLQTNAVDHADVMAQARRQSFANQKRSDAARLKAIRKGMTKRTA